jgi:hypothetical protein
MVTLTPTYVADTPRGASAALMKTPDACPHCGSHALTRRGTRSKKLEILQLWRCASCERTFTPGPEAIRGKTYLLRTVIDASFSPRIAAAFHCKKQRRV